MPDSTGICQIMPDSAGSCRNTPGSSRIAGSCWILTDFAGFSQTRPDTANSCQTNSGSSQFTPDFYLDQTGLHWTLLDHAGSARSCRILLDHAGFSQTRPNTANSCHPWIEPVYTGLRQTIPGLSQITLDFARICQIMLDSAWSCCILPDQAGHCQLMLD